MQLTRDLFAIAKFLYAKLEDTRMKIEYVKIRAYFSKIEYAYDMLQLLII